MRRTTGIRVARLLISPATSAKINGKHQLSNDEIRSAVVNIRSLPYRWDNDPVRGLRAYVEVWIRNRRAIVVLRPNNDPMGDVFDLATAYFVD